jgi:hypothetical protein
MNNIKPRQGYQVLSADLSLTEEHQEAILLVETTGALDFLLRLDRDTLVRLGAQIAAALADRAFRAAPRKDA